MGVLRHRTWRWFAVRLSGLSSESALARALVDPDTGERRTRGPVRVIDDVESVEEFFAKQGRGA